MRPIIRTVTASLLVLSFIVAACSRDSMSPGSTPNAPAPSLRVSLSPKNDTAVVGASTQLTARVFDDRNIPRDNAVEWRSANPSIASVSSTGLVAALSLGAARIIAQAGSAADTATILVQAPPSLSVSPGAALVMLGDSLRLIASASSAAGTAASVSGVQWVSSDPTIATINADGVLSAIEEGAVTISAQLSGITASASVDVLRGSVGSLTVAPQNATILPAETLQLTATGLDDAGRVLTGVGPKWASSNLSVAIVSDDGLVTGVAKGLAIITAQAKNKKATASVTVLGVPAATVAVSLANSSLSVGQTTQATATVKDALGNALSGRVIAWQSSNPALATVDSRGLVTAIANGSVNISAICEAKIGSAPLTVSSPVPTSIAIVPASVSLRVGQNTQLAAEVRDAKGVAIPNRPIKWTSGNAAVAPVTTAGVVTANEVGSTSVQASADGLATSAPVAVTVVPAASVLVSPSSLALTIGDTARLSATVRDAAGTTLTDRAVSWSSSNAAIATVGATGLVTAVGSGSVSISAIADGITSSSAVTVAAPPPSPVASVSVTLAATSLAVGATTQAVAVLRDAAGNPLTGRTVTWSSENTGVATVSATGVVTAVSAGSASIVATSENQTGGATVTVAAPTPMPVGSVTLSATSTSLAVGATLQVTATLKDSLGHALTGRTVGWTSSNTTVATVSSSGLVTGRAAGSVTVTATSEGKSGALSLTILPVPVATVTVVLAVPSVLAGQSTQATATLRDASGNVLTGRAVTWSSSASSVATVSATGAVSTLSAGTANVVATSEGKSGSAALTVTTPPVSSPPPSCALVTGTASRVESALAKPGYLNSVIDPDFGTTITRISGDPGTPIGNGIAGTWPSLVYHNYPKDPVFTADQKLLVLKHVGSSALFLDGTTYQPLFTRSGPANGGGEWRLHPTLPDIVVALGSNGSVSHWNVRTNVTTTKIPAVAGYTSNELGPNEGNVSRDGRYLVAKAVRSSDNHLVARLFDVDGGTTGAVIDLTAANVTNLDWVSISAGGGYVVAFATIDGATSGLRTKLWSRSTGAQVGYWSDNPLGHYDLGFDQAGNEVAFGSVSSGTYAHKYIMRRLDTGAITDLTGAVTSYNWHAGTRGPAGWGFAATNDRTGYATDGEILAVKLDGSKTIQRWAHHRASNASYDRSAFPTASPDGKRIVFASDWEQGSGPLQAYVVDIRPICP